MHYSQGITLPLRTAYGTKLITTNTPRKMSVSDTRPLLNWLILLVLLGDYRYLDVTLNFLAVLMYTFTMSQLRQITIAIVCLLIALPSWAFATCCCDTACCCAQCCQSSACCCGCSQLTGDSCCLSAIGNQCDLDCKCCTVGPRKKAVRSAKGETDQCSLASSSERYKFAPSISMLENRGDLFVWRPLSHNRRQAML